jgi:hypothetical protein
LIVPDCCGRLIASLFCSSAIVDCEQKARISGLSVLVLSFLMRLPKLSFGIRKISEKGLAHERGREAAKGYGYEYSNLQERTLHRLQHKFDDFGRANVERIP